MSWSQLRDWYEYYHLEPFGEESADLRNSLLCSLVYNANVVKGKGRDMSDFMLFSPDTRAERNAAALPASDPRSKAAQSFMAFSTSVKTKLKPSAN